MNTTSDGGGTGGGDEERMMMSPQVDDDDDIPIDDHDNNEGPSSKPSRLSSGLSAGDGRDEYYGAVIPSVTKGNFPSPGSILGPYFCVGRLGKGTFASINQCINLAYYHRVRPSSTEASDLPKLPKCAQENPRRLAAAKVEVDNFNVLGNEASVLEYLAEAMPKGTVPMYMGHLRSYVADTSGNNDEASSVSKPVEVLFMEYLPGRDMGQIREWWTRQIQQPQSADRKRRLSVKDAVFLCSNVLLPLLRSMHDIGIVHRDVKASNVVKRDGRSSTDTTFALVDFGLSRQITAAYSMSAKDVNHVWKGSNWMRPVRYIPPADDGQPEVYYKQERTKAEFRGTSMYASPRVHQLRDHCARDDMWSLMYVFCDLVAGGLPWMQSAANRKRDECQVIKERIHGMTATATTADGKDADSASSTSPSSSYKTDHSQLLMGGDYFIALFRKYRGGIDPPADGPDENVEVPPPLAMSKDIKKVMALDYVFEHLKELKFTDVPDYDLIQMSMEAFLDDQLQTPAAKEEQNQVPDIDWNEVAQQFMSTNKGGTGNLDESGRPQDQPLWGGGKRKVPTWEFEKKAHGVSSDDVHDDPVDWLLFAEAEENHRESPKTVLDGEDADMERLPLEMRFRIAQMEFNTQHSSTIEPHLALRDWLRVALPLLNGEWDPKIFEKGGHRSSNDGYRREFFERLVDKCLACSDKFNGFRDSRCYYYSENDENTADSEQDEVKPRKKRRKVITTGVSEPRAGSTKGLDLVLISKVVFDLKMTKKKEEKLSRAPPPRLSFGAF